MTFTIGKKFSLACAVLVLFTIVLGSVSIYNISGINTNLQAIVVDSLPGVATIAEVRGRVLQIRGGAWKHIATPDTSAMEKVDVEIAGLKQQAAEFLQAYEKTITLAEDRAIYSRLRPQLDAYLAAWEGVQKLSLSKQKPEAYAGYISSVDPPFLQLRASINELVEWNKRNGEVNGVAATEAGSRAQFWCWSLLGFAVLAGSLLAFLITKSINGVLRRAIGELSEGAGQVASAAGQVASSSQSLAQGSSEQAASLEETSASSEEINSMARKNTDNSRTAADLVTQSQQKYVQTNQSLDQMVVAMADINTQSDKIAKIIKVIDEIAFQTNILALNAAVEAARAGEAGMGFAVVADEVRNLAQRCAQAAKDTAELIEESIAKSKDGRVKVDQVATAIRTITEESSKVKTLVDEVNLGSEEQARGIEQIAKAITQMEQVTQKTAANAEESASAAEELTAQSETLKDVVARLTAMVGGEASNGPARPTHRRSAQASAPRHQKGTAAVRRAAPKSTEQRAPVLAARNASEDAFPMDQDFKEF